MAGEKTEKATPKKRRDARKEGQVLKSQEINNSITIICAILTLVLLWKSMVQKAEYFFTYVITKGYDNYNLLNIETLDNYFVLAVKTFFSICGPLVVLIMVAGILINYLQVGFLFTPKVILPKSNRISIVGGFKRIFSTTTLINFFKSCLKIFACFYIGYISLKPLINKTVTMINVDINKMLEYGASSMTAIAVKLALAMCFISVIDYIFQWLEHEKKLKMSKQEVKDEYKNTEGNPEIKSRIRKIQTQMALSRMMQKIPESDVVITNPTHYAVVLKYDNKKHKAPIVTAKGADHIALRIKQIARENKIEIYESKQLAQALYKSTEIGDEIDPEFFNAVAEILAYIYSLKKKKL